MKNIPIALFSLSLLCTPFFPLEAQQPPATVSTIVAQFPVADLAEAESQSQALIALNDEALLEFCAMLRPVGKGDDANVRFALEALLNYVTGRGQPEKNKLEGILLKALAEEKSPELKAFIIRQIQKIATNRSISTLQPLLTDDYLHPYAIQALQTLGTSQAQQTLLAAYPGKNATNRTALINALGEMHTKSAVDSLLKAAEHRAASVRNAALDALAKIGSPKAESLIRERLKDTAEANEADFVRCLNYAHRLADHGNREKAVALNRTIIEKTQTRLPHLHIAALQQLVALAPENSTSPLLASFASQNQQVKGAVLRLAETNSNEAAAVRWIDAAKQASITNRASIIAMFAHLNDAKSGAYIKQAIQSEEKTIRFAAISAHAKRENETAISTLLSRLTASSDPDEAQFIKEELTRLPTKKHFGAIGRIVLNGTEPARIAAIELLALRRAIAQKPALVKAAREGTPKLKVAAIKALERIAEPADAPMLTDLVMSARGAAAQAAAQKALLATISGEDEQHGRDYLIEKIKGESPANQEKLIPALGRFGGEQSLKTIIPFTQNQNPKLQSVAIRALCNWPDLSAFTSLIAIADSSSQLSFRVLAIRGLVRIITTSDLLPIRKTILLGEALTAAERQDEKKLVISALANIKHTSALEMVAGYLRDKDLAFEAAVAALRISESKVRPEKGLSSEDAAVAIIMAQLPDASRIALQRYLESKVEHNKPPKGFTALFNGQDLRGWKGLVANPPRRAKMSRAELDSAQVIADSIMVANWRVENGQLLFDGHGASLCTVKDYENFEMYVDWKIGKHGDSGIYLKGSPQVQIWDPAQWPEGSGGLYNNKDGARKPIQPADNPIGDWNTFYIKMVDNYVTVYLNDVLVVDNVLMENYWERDKPLYASGQIELQSHKSPLAFRNIYIRELPRTVIARRTALIADSSTSGWQPIGSKENGWQVENGILFTNGKGSGWLSTVKEYDNFKLELEYRVPPGGNSGVFLRAPHQGDPAYSGMEIQVLDDYADKYANLKPWQYTSSIYAVQQPLSRASKQAGEWQTMEIICNGPLVKVTLNGVTTIDTNLIDHMHKTVRSPGIKRRSGHIGLQNHGARVEYRNIFITEIQE